MASASSSAPAPFSPIGVQQDAAVRVVKGALTASSLSALYGCIRGTLRAEPAMMHMYHYGVNMFSFAFPFFGIREYVVNPLLADVMQGQRREPPIPDSLHTRNLISSSISGIVAGGGLAGYMYGRRAILGGARTYGVLCFGLQLLGNELRVLRVQYLASDWHNSGDAPRPVAEAAPAPPVVKTRPTRDGVRPLPNMAPESASASATEQESSNIFSQLWSGLKSISPVKRITEEEYEARLLKQREQLRQAAKELDEAIITDEKTSQSRRV